MIDLSTYLPEDIPTFEDAGRYLRTEFQNNKDRFLKRFLEPLELYLTMRDTENYLDILKLYESLWDMSEAFSYKDAFNIEDNNFRAKVFSIINVVEMVENLGSTRIGVEGIELQNKVFNPKTQEFEMIPLTQVYELHRVDGTKLGLESTDLFAIRCWCTSTDQEHWLWINEDTTKDPLSAIASTCMVYEKMIPFIKHIIRQGDVFIFELTEAVDIQEDDKVVPMGKEAYFKLLKSQS